MILSLATLTILTGKFRAFWGSLFFFSNLPSKTKVAYEYFAGCPDPPDFMIMQDDDTVADIGKSAYSLPFLRAGK